MFENNILYINLAVSCLIYSKHIFMTRSYILLQNMITYTLHNTYFVIIEDIKRNLPFRIYDNKNLYVSFIFSIYLWHELFEKALTKIKLTINSTPHIVLKKIPSKDPISFLSSLKKCLTPFSRKVYFTQFSG